MLILASPGSSLGGMEVSRHSREHDVCLTDDSGLPKLMGGSEGFRGTGHGVFLCPSTSRGQIGNFMSFSKHPCPHDGANSHGNDDLFVQFTIELLRVDGGISEMSSLVRGTIKMSKAFKSYIPS